jgi:predicted DNA-binding WGR domain protein
MAVTLICVDTNQNHQKFWTGEVLANGDLRVSWGRVGTKGQEKIHAIGQPAIAQAKLNKLLAEKRAKGYQQQEQEGEAERLRFDELSNGNAIVSRIETLEGILQQWQVVVDVRFERQTGLLVSQIGVLHHDRLLAAQTILQTGEVRFQAGARVDDALEQYLRLIPIRMGRLNPMDLFGNLAKLRQQRGLLDDLLRCIGLIQAIRDLIQNELANPATIITDKAQWVEWGVIPVVEMQAVVTDERMQAIEW